MRDLVGKVIIAGISAIFGVFIGTRFYWIVGFSPLAAHAISLIATIEIAWFC